MGKIVKVVAAVGLIVAGAISGNPQLILAGISIGSSALAKKPKAPKNSPEALDRLRASIDPRTPRKAAVGITALATDIRDEEFTGSQTYLHRFIVVASHKIQEVTSIFFDEKVAWTLAGGVQGEFVGYLTVAPILEGSAANAINISARMGSTRRYTGLAYVHLRYKLTGNSKKTDSPFAQSITTRITVRGKGAFIYDPRLDSTVPGGSGSHRAATQSTWAWSDTACRNPALQLLWFLLGWKITNPVTSAQLLVVGKGIPPARIDLASFAIAANLCDEAVALAAGGTEPRYRSDGVWSEGDSPTTVIDMLKASMNADLDDVDGKLRLTIFHNDLASPVGSFTANDVLGDFDWQPSPPLDQSFNIVRGVYTDASDTSLYQPVDYPQIEATSPDGIDRIDTFDLPMVQSAAQAQRLARLRLNRQKFGGVFEATFQATAWAAQKNSAITLTFPAAGFTSKLFRVAEMELREDGTVPIKLREESTAIYGYVADAAPVAAVATTPYNLTLNPIIDAIVTNSAQIVGVSSGAAYGNVNGTTTTATMAAVGDVLTVVVPASGNVNLDASYSFTAAGTGIFGEFAQWYRDTGAYTALGSETAAANSYASAVGEPGDGVATYSATGLTVGATERFRVYMRNSSGTVTRTISGSCSATPV